MTGGSVTVTARLPWQRGWLYHAPGRGRVLIWLVALHLAMLVGLVTAPRPSLPLVVAALALNVPGALGLSLCFHRSIAHKAVTFRPWLEQVLIFWAMYNGSGSPASWAAAHHVHHRHEDTVRDVSSPVAGGFWWAHLRWLWQVEPIAKEEYPATLQVDRYLRWQRWQPVILALALIWPIWLGFTAWLWLGPVRLVYIFHAQALVNSAAHMGERSGRGGTSKNLVWLAVLHYFLGENWHRNHHVNPASARIGETWWQIDLGWHVIRLLAASGLVMQIRLGRSRPGASERRRAVG